MQILKHFFFADNLTSSKEILIAYLKDYIDFIKSYLEILKIVLTFSAITVKTKQLRHDDALEAT